MNHLNCQRCLLCNEYSPEIHLHHIVPIAWGGDMEGTQISICNSCHDALHNQVKQRIKGNKRNKKAEKPQTSQTSQTSQTPEKPEKDYISEILIKNPQSQINKYIDIAVKAYYIYQNAKLQGATDNVLKRCILQFREIDLRRLQHNRKLYGFKTIEDYICFCCGISSKESK